MKAAPWRPGDEADWAKARVAAALLLSSGGVEDNNALYVANGKLVRRLSAVAMTLALWSLVCVLFPSSLSSTSLLSSLVSVFLSAGAAWVSAQSSARLRARLILAAAGHRWGLRAVAAGSSLAPQGWKPEMAARILCEAVASREQGGAHLVWVCAKEGAKFGEMAGHLLGSDDVFSKAYALVAFCAPAKPSYRKALRDLDQAEPGPEQAEELCEAHFPAEHARWLAERLEAGVAPGAPSQKRRL